MPEGVSTEESSSEPLTSDARRGLKGAGLRYEAEDGVPSWAVGKTADEILAMTQDLYNVVQTGGNPSHGSTPEPPPMQPPTNDVDANLIYTNPEEFTRRLRESIRTEMRQELSTAAAPLTGGMAGMAKRQSMQDRKGVWESYGPEIETIMASVPTQNHGSVDLWNQAADIVAGRHIDEIARKRADEMLRRGDVGTIRTNEGGALPEAASTRSPIAKLFDEKHPSVLPFIRDNIDAKQVEAHAAKMGHTPEAYAELLQKRVKVAR